LAEIQDLRDRVAEILWGPENAVATARPSESSASQPPFSAYDLEGMERATALAGRFMEIADATGGEEGLAAAVDEMEQVLATEPPGLVQHAVKLFLTHHKEAGEKLLSNPQ